jgi:hypothetical protein
MRAKGSGAICYWGTPQLREWTEPASLRRRSIRCDELCRWSMSPDLPVSRWAGWHPVSWPVGDGFNVSMRQRATRRRPYTHIR